jgi:hypothetical protein
MFAFMMLPEGHEVPLTLCQPGVVHANPLFLRQNKSVTRCGSVQLFLMKVEVYCQSTSDDSLSAVSDRNGQVHSSMQCRTLSRHHLVNAG